jgi:hypothetical protein
VYAPDKHGHAAAVRVAECKRTLLPAAEIAANAALIAAAPQLLSALQRLTRPDDGRGPADEDLAYAMNAIRAATGSQ